MECDEEYNGKEHEIDHWNYRVIQHNDKGEDYFAIHEVYYTKENQIVLWSKNSISAFGMSLSELRENMNMQNQALNKEILILSDLEQMIH